MVPRITSERIQDIIDRLSDLPDSVLHHILSFLDTKSSVQTCILSRRWRSLWKYVPVLTFSKSSLRSNCDFEQYVDKVLSVRSDCSIISKVTIDFHKKEKHLFDRVMKYAASHGVEELFIFPTFGTSLEVFGPVCSCYQSLKVLQLNLINIDKKAVGLWSCLQLLQSLTLTDCCFTYGDVFANFPRLETLKLDRCFHSIGIGTSVLKVTGSKLLDLEIVFPEFDSLQIVGPQLQSLSLKIGPSFSTTIPEVSKSNLPSLNRANIKLLGKWHMFLDTCSSSGNDYHKQMLLDCCASLFKILHNVQALDLQVVTFEVVRTVFLCYQSLKVLELNRVFVEQNVVEFWSRLELIESLTLSRCCLNFECRLNFDDAFASFPRLETLKLNHCFSSTQIRTSVLKVIVSKLLNLEIVLPEFSSLEIVAPKLQFLSLGIDHTIRLDVSKSNLPSLNRANIKLLGNWHVIPGISSYSSEDFFKKQLLVEHLFQILRNVQTLNLQVENFEVCLHFTSSQSCHLSIVYELCLCCFAS
ncbi:Putative F-box/LRR-repeat protein At5g02930 [Linum perenne]